MVAIDEGMKLQQAERGDGVLTDRFEPLLEPAQRLRRCMVEKAAELRIAVGRLQVRGNLLGPLQPDGAQSGLEGPDRRQQCPDLVAELASDALRMDHPALGAESLSEERVEQLLRGLTQPRPSQPHVGLQVGDGEHRVPVRVDTAVDEGGLLSPPSLGIQRVVILVGILAAAVEATRRVAENRLQVGGGRVKDLALFSQGQGRQEAGVILQHLLEMGDAPVLCRRVAEEAALDVVVGASARHLGESEAGHLHQLRFVPRHRLFGEKRDGLGLRKLWGAAKAAVGPVIRVLAGRQHGVDEARHQRPGARGDRGRRLLPILQDLGDDLRLVAPIKALHPLQRAQHLLGRKVGGPRQHVPLRGEEDGGRPATHVVSVVDVGAEVVVDPDGNEGAVQVVDHRLVGVGRLVHHVAPVAPDR